MLGGLELAGMESPRGLRVAGELDISNVSALADALEEELGAGEDVTLDLRDVTFVDSTGLQVLFGAARRLEGRGRLILIGPQPRVRTLFKYVLLDGHANVDVRDAAEESRKQSGSSALRRTWRARG